MAAALGSGRAGRATAAKGGVAGMPEWMLAILVGVIAASGTWLTTRFGRVAALERRLTALESRERRLWLYCRQLIDHIWRGRGAPPPDPPADMFGDVE